MHMLEGALLNNTEEKTALMCLSLEYMFMGRTSFTFINQKEKNKNKKFLLTGDLCYSLGASAAAKTKSLFFYKIFSNQCVFTSNVFIALQNHLIKESSKSKKIFSRSKTYDAVEPFSFLEFDLMLNKDIGTQIGNSLV